MMPSKIRLTARERKMLIAVLATLFVVGNLMVLSSLFKSYATLGQTLASKQMQLRQMQLLGLKQQTFAQRDQWLKEHQPKLENRDKAEVALWNQVKEAAKAFSVALGDANLHPNIGADDPAAKPPYQPIRITFTTTSTWADLVNFLYLMQQPANFIVFEEASLEVDHDDATKMHGSFTIAKWYAPGGN